MIMNDAIKNFSEFPALGLVLAVMIGIGAAEKSGYFDKLLISVVNHASKSSFCQQLYLSVLWAVLLVMQRPSFYPLSCNVIH